MKWLGQYIQNFKATFRQDVTLDSTLTFDSVALTGIQTSAESFVDDDVSIMTSAAIDDRINTAVTAEDLDVAADSGTAAVDLNSQSLTVTGGTNATTSATGQAVTINVDDAFLVNDGSDTTTGTITAAGFTTTGTIEVAKRKISVSTATDGNVGSGYVVYFGGTTSMTIGTIYHYKSDGTWEVTNANAVATCDGLLAVALGAASDVNGMLLRGMVTLDHDPGAIGDVLFLSAASNGDATATAPSGSSDIVRVIGYCLDASNGQIWFDPDKTYVEVA